MLLIGKSGQKAIKAVDSRSPFLAKFPTLPSTIASCLHLGGACLGLQGFVALGPVSGRNSG